MKSAFMLSAIQRNDLDVIGSNTYNTYYAYNIAGELTQITYPSGRIVQQSMDNIGRLCAVAQSASSCTSTTGPYASGYGYNAAGELTNLDYGNGISATIAYSPDRLQPSAITYANGATTLFGLSYSYGSAGSNNGQIQGITDTVHNGRSVSYSYDALNRLISATTAGDPSYPQWGLSWGYDRYGNRQSESIISGTCTAMTCPHNSLGFDPASNRINSGGYSYDANGNLTNDGSNSLGYDGENHLVSSSGLLGSGTYTYDGTYR